MGHKTNDEPNAAKNPAVAFWSVDNCSDLCGKEKKLSSIILNFYDLVLSNWLHLEHNWIHYTVNAHLMYVFLAYSQ